MKVTRREPCTTNCVSHRGSKVGSRVLARSKSARRLEGCSTSRVLTIGRVGLEVLEPCTARVCA